MAPGSVVTADPAEIRARSRAPPPSTPALRRLDRRAGAAGAPGRDAAHRVHRPGLPGRPGLRRVRRRGHGPRHAACPAGPAAGRPASTSPCSPPRPRPRRATTSTSAWPRPSTWWGPRRPSGPRSLSLALYRRAARRVAERRGSSLADTKFELGLRRRRPGPLRRGGHPGLLAPVAGRPGGAGHHPAGLRQAAAARLGGGRGLGQAAAPAAPAPRGGAGRPPSATWPPTSGSPGAGWATGTVPAAMRFSARVEVRLRPGIADPEGATIERALPALGFDDVSQRAGRPVVPLRAGGRRRARRPPPGRGAGPPAAGQPGHRGEPPGDRWPPPRRERLMATRVGVVVFPGTNCEHDVVAARRPPGRRRAELVWHGGTTWPGSTPSCSPAGSPTATTCGPGPWPASPRSWRRWPSSPRPAARWWGSATASRSSPRRGCCPGRCRRTGSCASCARRSGCGWPRPARCSPPGVAVGTELRAPHQPLPGQLRLRPGHPRRAGRRGPGGPALHREPQRLGRRHRRHRQRGRQRGRPHAPPRAGRRTSWSARPTGRCCCGRCSGAAPRARAA